MTPALPPDALARFSEQVAGQLGLHFPRERWRELEAGLRAAARKLGIDPTETNLDRLWRDGLSRRDIEVLAGELTVGETYFFRDARTFDFLRERVLPELISRGESRERRLRIWSAGCCTGEEPYSIAILLDRCFPELSSWHVTILGTDINPRFLQRATEGVFSEWSFRDAPAWLKEQYFRPAAGQRYEVLPRIRERVTFAYLNLAEGAFPSLANGTNACDLILCRNVLMYFTPERIQTVIAGFRCALLEPGWLIVSAAETSPGLSSAFTSVHYAGATFYRKSGAAAEAPALTPPAATHDVENPWRQASVPAVLAAPDTAGTEACRHENFNDVPHNDDAPARFAHGDYAGTVHQLEAAATSRTLSKPELALLARACANLGDLAAAHDWAERALAIDKLDASLHYLRALIVQEQGDVAESAAGLRRALYLDPDFVLAHFGLGNLALRQARRAEAIRHFSNARRLLERRPPDEVLPHSDGLSAGRLKAAIESALAEERAA